MNEANERPDAIYSNINFQLSHDVNDRNYDFHIPIFSYIKLTILRKSRKPY